MHKLNYKYSSDRLSDIQCANDLTKVNLTGTTLNEMCMSEYHNNNYSCIGKDFDYRTRDGSCNNLKRKYLGKANTPYKRLLFAVYKDGNISYFFMMQITSNLYLFLLKTLRYSWHSSY